MKHPFIYFLVVVFMSCSAGWLPAAPPEVDDIKKPVIKPPLLPSPPNAPDDSPEPAVKSEGAPAPRRDEVKAYEVIYVTALETAAQNDADVPVGFFNHGERDLVLEIGERTVRLKSRFYLQIKLPREFSWREQEGAVRTTKIPAEAAGVEIVFRK